MKDYILNRPMFQRRLTKDELKAYGLPAFANGGVVQKFFVGGGVKKVEKEPGPTLPGAKAPIYPGLMFKEAAIERVGGDTTIADTVMETFEQKSLDKSDLNVTKLDVRQIESRIQQLENQIQQKKSAGLDVSAEQAELNQLKTKLAEAQKAKLDAQKKVDQPTTGDTKTDATGTVKDKAPIDELTAEEDELSRLKTLALERSDLYKQMLGDPKEMMKQQGLLQLAQFGLNLASARGGNLAEKIAKSATDPLQAFAQLASDASKDARAIDLAAIKSAEDQLMLETELSGKQDDLVKINLYAEAKRELLNDVAAATSTTYLPQGEMVDIDIYRDDQDRIVSKEVTKDGGANKVYKNEAGKPFRINLAHSKREKYLKWPGDFELIEGVEIITSGTSHAFRII
jgi:hypothetical protein